MSNNIDHLLDLLSRDDCSFSPSNSPSSSLYYSLNRSSDFGVQLDSSSTPPTCVDTTLQPSSTAPSSGNSILPELSEIESSGLLQDSLAYSSKSKRIFNLGAKEFVPKVINQSFNS